MNIKMPLPEDTKIDPGAFKKHIGEQMLKADQEYGPGHTITKNLADIALKTRDANSMQDVQMALMTLAKDSAKQSKPNAIAFHVYTELKGVAHAHKPEPVQGGLRAGYGDFFKLQSHGLALVEQEVVNKSNRIDRSGELAWVEQMSNSSRITDSAKQSASKMPALNIK